jgi:predicted transglutaminase-like cysteine proteinase
MNLDQLKLVNAKVNLLPYRADAERYFTPEWWAEIDADGGDCEDFAIAKLRRLMADGWPISALRLATCFVERTAGPKPSRYHAVLLADLDNTTYVLDNRHPYPMEYDMLEYEWHKLQVAGTRQWEWAQDADKTIS